MPQDRNYIVLYPSSSGLSRRLESELKASGGVLAVDTETSGVDVFAEDFELYGVVLTADGRTSYYLPVMHIPFHDEFLGRENSWESWLWDPEQVRQALLELFDAADTVVWHNRAYDQLVLERSLGLDLHEIPGEDTMLMAYLVDENERVGLKELAQRYLGISESTPAMDKDYFTKYTAPLSDSTNSETLAYPETLFTADESGKVELVEGWTLALNEHFRKFHNGALSYNFVAKQFMGNFARTAKRLGVEGYQFKGTYKDSFKYVPLSSAAFYAGDDAINTWLIYQALRDGYFSLNEDLWELYQQVESPVNEVMTAATLRGIQLDVERLGEMRDNLDAFISEYTDEVYELLDDLIPSERADEFNYDTILGSNKQMALLLYDVLGFPVGGTTKTGNPSVNAAARKQLISDKAVPKNYPNLKDKGLKFIELTLRISTITKLRNTYTDGLIERADAQGRLHPSYNTVGTVSGRFSSSNPNWQNLPRLTPEEVEGKPWLEGIDIRGVMVADEGHVFVSADFSSMEVILMAWQSQDPALKKIILEGLDMHSYTARSAFNVGHDLSDEEFKSRYPVERQNAKAVNFAMQYGGTEYTLMKNLGFSREQAKQVHDGYQTAYAGLIEYEKRVHAQLLRDGMVTYRLFPFRKHLNWPPEDLKRTDSRAYDRQLAAALRTSFNAISGQGVGAYIVKDAIVRIDRELSQRGIPGQVMFQIHDEIGVMVPIEYAEEVAELMSELMTVVLDEDFTLIAEPEIRRTLSSGEDSFDLMEYELEYNDTLIEAFEEPVVALL